MCEAAKIRISSKYRPLVGANFFELKLDGCEMQISFPHQHFHHYSKPQIQQKKNTLKNDMAASFYYGLIELRCPATLLMLMHNNLITSEINFIKIELKFCLILFIIRWPTRAFIHHSQDSNISFTQQSRVTAPCACYWRNTMIHRESAWQPQRQHLVSSHSNQMSHMCNDVCALCAALLFLFGKFLIWKVEITYILSEDRSLIALRFFEWNFSVVATHHDLCVLWYGGFWCFGNDISCRHSANNIFHFPARLMGWWRCSRSSEHTQTATVLILFKSQPQRSVSMITLRLTQDE